MKLKDAINDTNEALRDINDQNYIGGLKYSCKFIKQGLTDLFQGIKVMLEILICLSVYPLLPILYPIAILVRVLMK